MKGLRFTVYRHPWQRLGRETTQGTWLEPPAKRVVRIVVRYLLRQGDCTFPRQESIRFRRHRIFLQISTHARVRWSDIPTDRQIPLWGYRDMIPASQFFF